MADGVYRRNSSNTGWVNYNDNNEVYVRDSSNSRWIGGSEQRNGTIFRRNSSNTGWEQIYPAGVLVGNSGDIYVSDNKYKQKAYSSWTSGSARQGWCVRDRAGGEQFGYMGMDHTQIPGAAKIDPGTVTFKGNLMRSGNYNNRQTIQMRGSTNSGSGDPFGSHDSSGFMNITWKATGQNSPIPLTEIPLDSNGGRNAALNFLNNVNGYGTSMCIYNGETNGSGSTYSDFSANYLAINNQTIKFSNYKYGATALILSRMDSPRMYMTSSSRPPQDDNYLAIALDTQYANLNTDQIIKLIDTGIIEYNKADSLITYDEFDYKPVIVKSYRDNGKLYFQTSPIFNENMVVEYKNKKNEWVNCFSYEPLEYFVNDNSKIINIRFRDIMTDEIINSFIL